MSSAAEVAAVADRRSGSGGQARPAASGKRRWSAGEDEVLVQWVTARGGTWRSLEKSGRLPARAMEGRWKGLRCKGATSGLAQDHIDRAAEAAGSQDRTPQDSCWQQVRPT